LVWLLELLHTIFSIHVNYFFGVTNFGNEAFLNDNPWSLIGTLFTAAIIDMIVQSWFAYRVKVLSKRWEVALLCWIMTLSRLGTVITLTALSVGHSVTELFVLYGPVYPRILDATFATGCVLDLIVAVSVSYYLLKIERRATRSYRRLMLIVVESGALSFLISLALVMSVSIDMTSYAWIAISNILAKVYSNTLLASLNSHHLWEVAIPLYQMGKGANFIERKDHATRSGLDNIRIEMTKMTSNSAGDEEQTTSFVSGMDSMGVNYRHLSYDTAQPGTPSDKKHTI